MSIPTPLAAEDKRDPRRTDVKRNAIVNKKKLIMKRTRRMTIVTGAVGRTIFLVGSSGLLLGAFQFTQVGRVVAGLFQSEVGAESD